MSVKIVGTLSGQEVEVDAASKAMRVTWYDINGNPNGPRNTYDAASAAFTPPATPQDVFVIQGSATKTARVTRIRVSGTQTTAGVNSWYLLRKTGSFTGGTFATPVAVSRDTNSPSATVATYYYTAAATTSGSLVGAVRATKLMSPAPAGTSNDNIIWDFDDFQTTPIYLRGNSQFLTVNFSGSALPTGLSLHCSTTWTEE
jgi:hypothetical protein